MGRKKERILTMTLTKAAIAKELQTRLGLQEKQCKEVIVSLMEIIKYALESGEDVLVSGFGKFCFKEKKKRKGRNPVTGKAMILDARRIVTFKCSGKLKDRINGKE